MTNCKILCATCGTCHQWHPDSKTNGEEGSCRNYYSPMHLKKMSFDEGCENWTFKEETSTIVTS